MGNDLKKKVKSNHAIHNFLKYKHFLTILQHLMKVLMEC